MDNAQQYAPKSTGEPADQAYEINPEYYPWVGSYYNWSSSESDYVFRLGKNTSLSNYVTTPNDTYKEVSIPSVMPIRQIGLMDYFWIATQIKVEGETYVSDSVETLFGNMSACPVTNSIVDGDTIGTNYTYYTLSRNTTVYFTIALGGEFLTHRFFTDSNLSSFSNVFAIGRISFTVRYSFATNQLSICASAPVKCSSHSTSMNNMGAFAYYEEL